MSRTFIIGDVHGQVELLDALLSHIPLALNDRLVFLGDYIDYGPYSREVIDLLLELLNDSRWTVDCLMGNHEQMFIEWLNYEDIIQNLPKRYQKARLKFREGYLNRLASQWELNDELGGAATLRSYGYGVPGCRGKLSLPRSHEVFLSSLSLHAEGSGWLAVHAGLELNSAVVKARSTGDALKNSDTINGFLWSRELVKNPPQSLHWDFRVICGHTIVDEPQVSSHVIAIDIGAKMCHGLCAFCPETDTFYFHDGERKVIGGEKLPSSLKVIELH